MKKRWFSIFLIVSILLSLFCNINVSADVQISDINSGWYWPAHISNKTITSPYGGYRTLTNGLDLHQGIDIAGGSTEIYAARYGDVSGKGCNSSMGNYVHIYHGEWNGYKIYSTYMHLAESAYVNVGATVQGGQLIGKMGTTGSSTGVHLHFQIFKSTNYYYSEYAPSHKTETALNSNYINTNPTQNMMSSWGIINQHSERFNNSNHPSCKYGGITYMAVGSSPNPPTTSAPTNTWINTDKSTAFSNDTVTLSWGADNATSYWLHIYRDGQDYVNQGMNSSTSYSHTYPDGQYTAWIQSSNSAGNELKSVNFTIATVAPVLQVWCNTQDPTNITSTSATFNGTFCNPAGARIVQRGFQWGETDVMTHYVWFDCDITWEDGLNHSMVGLQPNTTYYYKLVVKGEDGTVRYGDMKSFTTSPVPDTETPVISRAYASNIRSDSFNINCEVYDNVAVTRAYIIIYGPGGNSGNGFSIDVLNNFSYTVNTADYGGRGTYNVHIYVSDAAGNSTSIAVNNILAVTDSEVPVILAIRPTNISNKSFTINCDVYDNVAVTHAYIIVYGPGGNSGNGFNIDVYNSFSYTINTADYGGSGTYHVHVYVSDADGNYTSAACNDILASYVSDTLSNGLYCIKYKTTGQYISMGNNEIEGYATFLYEPGRNGFLELDQMLYFERLSNGAYKITSRRNGFAFEVGGLSIENEAVVQQWPYGGISSQQWFVVNCSDGYYKFINVNSEKALDIGARVQQWTDNGSDAQRFNIISLNYTVYYNANGGSEAPVPQNKIYGDNINLSDKILSRNGYTFWGWSENPNATMSTWASGDIFAENRSTTLYAYWKPNEYTITFDLLGGNSGINNKKVTYALTYGTLPTPTKSGHRFIGWYNAENGGTEVTEATSVTITDNQTLYARWEQLIPCTESTITKAASGCSANIKLYNIPESSKIIVTGYKDKKFVTMQTIDYTKALETVDLTGNIDNIKVMVWSSLDSLMPLTDVEEIPSSQWITE